MRERMFPRWCTALFALLPLSELLYLPADGQSVYAAALLCVLLYPFTQTCGVLHLRRSR